MFVKIIWKKKNKECEIKYIELLTFWGLTCIFPDMIYFVLDIVLIYVLLNVIIQCNKILSMPEDVSGYNMS